VELSSQLTLTALAEAWSVRSIGALMVGMVAGALLTPVPSVEPAPKLFEPVEPVEPVVALLPDPLPRSPTEASAPWTSVVSPWSVGSAPQPVTTDSRPIIVATLVIVRPNVALVMSDPPFTILSASGGPRGAAGETRPRCEQRSRN